MNKKLRILIVDDQRLFADGLKVVLESQAKQLEVIGIAENGSAAVSMVRRTRPDIVLMDVRMPVMNGVEATRVIHTSYPEIKILMLTTFSDDEYVTDSLRYGASGYLLKSRPAEELVDSVRTLATGILQIDPEVSASLVQLAQEDEREDLEIKARLKTLSRRERQILSLMVQVKRIVVIASELGLAEQTVRNHVNSIYSKLDIHDRLEIVNYIRPIREYLRETGE